MCFDVRRGDLGEDARHILREPLDLAEDEPRPHTHRFREGTPVRSTHLPGVALVAHAHGEAAVEPWVSPGADQVVERGEPSVAWVPVQDRYGISQNLPVAHFETTLGKRPGGDVIGCRQLELRRTR